MNRRASTLLVAALRRASENRRWWAGGHLLMAIGVALPIVSPGIVAIIVAALLVGGTFMVVTMVAMQESREVAGPQARGLMAAMTAAFALGQVVAPVMAGYAATLWGDFSVALFAASVLLAASAGRCGPRPIQRSGGALAGICRATELYKTFRIREDCTDSPPNPRSRTAPSFMLHITNGDATVAVMKRAHLPGEILPWRDVLHEGPTPAGMALPTMSQVRARFIAESGWAPFDKALAEFRARDARLYAFGAHEEVVLWFEHDLYDQLQLLQLLDWFSEQDLRATRLSLMCIDEYFGTMGTERLAGLYPRRSAVTSDRLQLAKTAWSAYCAPEPMEWQALIDVDTSALPYLSAAVARHLEQYPSLENGTNRTERTLLNVVNSGVSAPVKIFDAVQAYEESRFMGDSVFWNYLRAMVQSRPPLLEVTDAATFELPDACNNWDEFQAQTLTLTDSGQDVVACRADWVALNGIDKWRGGVHLNPAELWRWDADARTLVRSNG